METKKWFTSITIWGSLLVIISVILRTLGREQEAQIIEEESAAISQWIIGAIALVGAALAFVGRIRAKTKVTL